MTKKNFMNQYNITMREVTKEDMEKAETTYQSNSDYVITYHNGYEMYSQKGTLKDIQEGLSYALKQS